jgi:hypothetical protein
MKTVKTEAEISRGGTLLLEKLPFDEGERVLVTIVTPSASSEMRAYAEKMAPHSREFVAESNEHITERLLRETEW